jgi:3-hydroxyisobutyrate dehydrogenase
MDGRIILDLSTNHFRNVNAFHQLCTMAGGAYLETPVLGSVVPASQGALTVLVSGEKSAFETAQPVLEQIGKHVFHFSEPGRATRMKLINNLTLGSFMATIAEALALAEDIGMEREQVLDILAVGGGNSLVLNAKRAKLLDQDFSTHFSSALIYKDLHCLQDLAYEQKKTLFTGSVVKELYARTFEEGIDEEDFSAVYKLFARREGK